MDTTGSQQALDLIGRVLINPGDRVLCEEPTYLGALQAWNTYQAQYLLVGDVQIVQDHTTWKVVIGDSVWCDYKEFAELHDLLGANGGSRQRELVRRWSAILSGGGFLEEISYEWLDPIRAEVISSVVKLGVDLLNLPHIREEHETALHICSGILGLSIRWLLRLFGRR